MPRTADTENMLRIEQPTPASYRLYAGKKYICKLANFRGLWWNRNVGPDRLLPTVPDSYPEGLLLETRAADRYATAYFDRAGVYTYAFARPVVTLTATLPVGHGEEGWSLGELLSAMTDEAGKAGGIVLGRPGPSSPTPVFTVGLPWVGGTFGECLDDVRVMMTEAFDEALFQSQKRAGRRLRARLARSAATISASTGPAGTSAS